MKLSSWQRRLDALPHLVALQEPIDSLGSDLDRLNGLRSSSVPSFNSPLVQHAYSGCPLERAYGLLNLKRVIEGKVVIGHAFGRETLLKDMTHARAVEPSHAIHRPCRLGYIVDHKASDPLIHHLVHGTVAKGNTPAFPRRRPLS